MGVKGQIKNETAAIEVPDVNYRALKALNYSMIVEFKDSPASFVEQFILGKPKSQDETPATIIGNVVDDMLLTYKGNFDEFDSNFDRRYALYTGVETGTKQVFVLADALFEITQVQPDKDFKQRFLWAFDKVQKNGKYKGKTYDFALNDFQEQAQGYFQTKIDNIGKIVVSEGLLEKSRKIAKLALEDQFTGSIYDFSPHHSEDRYIKLAKVPITFEYECADGKIEGKCEVDHLDVDYERKQIIPMDTKSTYDNTIFPYSYKKNSYYIQNAWYTHGIRQWAKSQGIEDFEILPYTFVVLDTSNGGRRPLIYRTSKKMLVDAQIGWIDGAYTYKGLYSLVNDIIWSNENNEWGISKEAFLNNGIITL